MLTPAVNKILKALTLTDKDLAAVALTKQYAKAIDGAGELGERDALEKLGPKLLTVLEALGATPRARAALAKGGPAHVNFGPGAIDDLRDKRATRARRAARVHPTTTAADA